MHLEDRLCDVETNRCIVCIGSSSESWEPYRRPHLGTLVPGGAVHSITSRHLGELLLKINAVGQHKFRHCSSFLVSAARLSFGIVSDGQMGPCFSSTAATMRSRRGANRSSDARSALPRRASGPALECIGEGTHLAITK